jgi:hypothetical protein
MNSQVLITDVTRMQPPRVCIAGLTDGKTLRLATPQPTENALRSIGWVRPGDRLAVEWLANPFTTRPHVEDGTWRPSSARKLDRLTDQDFIDSLTPRAFASVEEAFGSEWFRGARGNGAFRPEVGERSLASVIGRNVRVYQWFDSVRVDFVDAGGRWTMVPLEDLAVRRHQKECHECVRDLNRNLKREFSSSRWLLRVGLTRPYKSEQHETACWLQVTGVYPMGRERKHFLYKATQ